VPAERLFWPKSWLFAWPIPTRFSTIPSRAKDTFEVNDLDVYWSELEPKDLDGSFAGVKVRPPTDFPWGREIHIIDPGGVCWHVRQRRS
jgi:hypothetical protein